MNIAVFGTGFVAGAYLRAIHYLGYHPLVLSRAWLNPDDASALALCLDGYKPQYIISASGFHVDTVDQCQWDKRGCYHDHVLLPRALSDYCASRDVTFIHVSSGCIFNGVGPFKETDEPNFETGFYQHCKVEAEVDIVTSGARAFIFRIRMPYSHFVHPRNWLVKLCEYDRILDGLNSVTMLDTFALRSLQLATGGKAEPGIYHCADSLPIRTAQVARMLQEVGLRTKPVEIYPPDDFLMKHVARSAAVLDVTKFETAYGSKFGDPLVGLRWCIDKLSAGGLIW